MAEMVEDLTCETVGTYRKLKYSIFGGIIGYAVLHPFAMVTDELNHRLMYGVPGMTETLNLIDILIKTISYEMLAMSTMFTIFGSIIGFVYAKYEDRIEMQNIRLTVENAEKQKLIKKLAEEDQILRLYESGLQHDWKNYLMIIGGFSRKAAKTDSAEKRKRYLQAVTTNVEAFEKCLQEKLELTSLINPEIPLRIDFCDTYSILCDSIKFCYQDQEGKNVYVNDSRYPMRERSDLNLTCNERLISSLFNNIICNALKYGNNLFIKVLERNNCVRFVFRDEGRGMSEDELAKVFSLGGRNQNALGNSTHIGMPYSKLIVEKHKGKIWCESEFGRGTTFYVELPKGL